MIASVLAQITTQRATAMVIGAVIFIGAAAFIAWQVISARKETGSEIELAPNRKPYYDDEELEGPRLNYALWFSFGMLVIIAVSLPMYWLAEPGRQDGAVEDFKDIFTIEGEELYVSGAQCVNCHAAEGVGGVTEYIVTDEDGNFVQEVNWTAPALDTVLYRYSTDEVKDVLTYGRPGTPMAAWGVEGGGPLTDQDLDKLIDYLWSIQIDQTEIRESYDEVIEQFDSDLAATMVANRELNADVEDPLSDEYVRMDPADELKLGEFMFSLDNGNVGGNAGSCARCHVPGASYGQTWSPAAELGTGRFAPNLIGIEDALTEKQHFAVVWNGTEFGKPYGANSQGSGRMPGFGINSNELSEAPAARDLGTAGMLTAEQIWSIVAYERNLTVARAGDAGVDTPAAAFGGDAGATTGTEENT